jgi:peptide/nickel transport system substrate-binding protein
MSKRTRNSVIAAAAILIAAAMFAGYRARRDPASSVPAGPASSAPTRGGDLVASVHTDPKSFNRFLQRDSTTDLVTTLTHSKLVRLNRITQDIDPWLAESWTRAADGLSYTLALRPNVTFADGHPFTADDVLFSFDAAYDERVGSAIADTLKVGGRRLRASAPNPLTVVVTFPETFAPGLRILDNLPIYPKHALGDALKGGSFGQAWGLGTPPAQIVGLGPFVLTEYAPGQRLVFARNPRYWRKAANGDALPYLDRVTIEIIPEQDSEVLRLDAGRLDMTATELRAEDYTPLKRAADAGRLRILDLGVGFDADNLWFNLKPGGLGPGDTRASWLQSDALRRAISLAVDRELFANTVFLGAGVPIYGPISAANKKWHADLPPVPHDAARARKELESVGLADRDGDGLLEDAGNRPARFAVITQKGNTTLERGAAVIRDELKKIGLTVDVVALDGNAVINSFLSGKYEAVYFRITTTDTDPAINMDLWLSSGSSHIWNPEQKAPGTDWERDIDGLMRRQMATFDEAERKRLFDEVQKIFADHLPTIQFVAPRVYVAVSTHVTVASLTPTAFSRPQLLWMPDTIAVVH